MPTLHGVEYLVT